MEVNGLLDISNFPWAECTISENRVTYQGDSLSLKRNKRDMGILRYEFELVTIDMEMSLGRKVKAKLSKATKDTLVFIHPRLSYSQGTEPAEGISVFGTNLVGSESVEMTSVGVWQLMAGDIFQFSNDTKIYEVAEDTALTSGTQTVELTNGIRTSPPSASSVTVNGVAWHLISTGAIETSMNASDNQDIELTLVAVEKL